MTSVYTTSLYICLQEGMVKSTQTIALDVCKVLCLWGKRHNTVLLLQLKIEVNLLFTVPIILLKMCFLMLKTITKIA